MVKMTRLNPNVPTNPAPMNFNITVAKTWDSPQVSNRFPNQFAMKVIGSLKKFILLSSD
jgi:hypothetical protein